MIDTTTEISQVLVDGVSVPVASGGTAVYRGSELLTSLDISTIENNITTNTNSINQLESSKAEQSDLDTLRSTVANNADSISALESDVNNVSNTLNQASSDLNDLTSQFNELSTDVDNMSTVVNQTSSDLSELSTEVDSISTNVSTLFQETSVNELTINSTQETLHQTAIRVTTAESRISALETLTPLWTGSLSTESSITMNNVKITDYAIMYVLTKITSSDDMFLQPVLVNVAMSSTWQIMANNASSNRYFKFTTTLEYLNPETTNTPVTTIEITDIDDVTIIGVYV